MSNNSVLRLPAEIQYEKEIEALISAEGEQNTCRLKMSPQSVLTYITGGKVKGVDIILIYRKQEIGRNCNIYPCD
jgi:hypothetical protein